MRKIFWILPALVLFLYTTSCTNWEDEDPISYYYEVIAFVSSNDAKPTFFTDFGTTLESSLSVTSDTGDVFHNGERVFLRFSYDDTTSHAANTYSIKIAEYAAVNISSFKTIKPDSIDPYFDQVLYHVYRLYITGNYFNSIVYTYQPLSDLNTCELVRVMKNENNEEATSFPTLNFELRHNAQAINYEFYKLRLYSYDLSPLIDEFPAADSIKLRLSWSESTGSDQSFDFVYHPVPSVGLFLSDVKMPKWKRIEGLLKP